MDLEAKKTAILDHETHMANLLADKVIYKPALSVWMILIPVVFIYYFWRLQRFSQGKRDFVQQWMRQREACIEEAFRIAGGQNPTPVGRMVPKDRLPPAAVGPYARWVECLTQHFTDLMSSRGDNLQELVRTAYHKRGNYLIFLNQLNEREQTLNAALVPDLDRETPGAADAAHQIEKYCRQLRRQEAERLFG